MTEVKQFRLPDVGEGLTEADIVSWHVRPGDQVSVNQVIVEIETAKAVVELPSPFDGVVTGLLVEEGQTVDVGTPIIAVDVAPEAVAAEAEAGAAASAPAAGTPAGTPPAAPPAGQSPGGSTSGAAATRRHAPEDLVPAPPAEAGVEPGLHGTLRPKPERQAVLVGYGVKLGATTRRPRKRPAGGPRAGAPAPPAATPPAASRAAASPAAVQPAAPSAPPQPAPVGAAPAALASAAGNGAGARALAKPPVRKLAKDLGVDLGALTGSGPGGLITRDDVQAAAAGPSQPARQRTAAGAREERVAIRGVRKHTAAAVSASAFTAPHVTEFLQADVTATMDAAGRIAGLPEFAGVRVSPLLLVARALLLAVARNPMINSSWDGDAQEIVVKRYVNLGIAVATGRGLLVPNIKDAQDLSLPALAQALNGLAATARDARTAPAELAGGTITITNVGVFGVDAGTPILTPGEAAILAFGRVRDAPWVEDGQLVVRKVTTLSLSFDHRIVDGDLGSAVLRDVGAMLTDPVRMLAWS
jgi:pyruvate dehydrogenase E2 component (dihydrolipoamide acetyltransferase)